jgi:hypothetical protein
MLKEKVVFDFVPNKNLISITSNLFSEIRVSFTSYDISFESEDKSTYVRSDVFITKRGEIDLYFVNSNKWDFEITSSFKSFIDKIKSSSESKKRKTITIEEVERKILKEGFTRQLKPFQKRNLLQLINSDTFADFSVPGAGKTSVALAYFFFKKESNDKLIIVAPKTTFIAWKDEIEKCFSLKNIAKRFNFVELIGAEHVINNKLNSSPDFVILSYEKLRSTSSYNSTTDQISEFVSKERIKDNSVFIFLDEAHKIKKGSSGATGAAAELLRSCQLNPDHKLILTGTPMPQSPEDLVPLYDFVKLTNNGLPLNDIYNSFKSSFVRTTKSELKIKEKNIIPIIVEMSDANRNFYESIVNIGHSMYENHISLNASLDIHEWKKYFMIMLQAASNPALLVNNRFSNLVLEHNDSALIKLLKDVLNEGASNKMIEACNLARKLISDGKKVVIWSGFVKSIEEITDILSDVGSVCIHGGTSSSLEEDMPDTRKGIIDRFHNDKNCNVLVANPSTCAEGISLHHACNSAIYLDRGYNLTQYLQSVDRIHRLGLPDHIETDIYILKTKDTIDEAIDIALIAKEDAMNKFLDTGELVEIEGVSMETLHDNDESSLEVEKEDIPKILKIGIN